MRSNILVLSDISGRMPGSSLRVPTPVFAYLYTVNSESFNSDFVCLPTESKDKIYHFEGDHIEGTSRLSIQRMRRWNLRSLRPRLSR